MGFNELHLYDAFTVTSLINEPACMFVESTPCSLGVTAVYSPAFVPTSIAQNYVADDGHSEALSYTLPPARPAPRCSATGAGSTGARITRC